MTREEYQTKIHQLLSEQEATFRGPGLGRLMTIVLIITVVILLSLAAVYVAHKAPTLPNREIVEKNHQN